MKNSSQELSVRGKAFAALPKEDQNKLDLMFGLIGAIHATEWLVDLPQNLQSHNYYSIAAIAFNLAMVFYAVKRNLRTGKLGYFYYGLLRIAVPFVFLFMTVPLAVEVYQGQFNWRMTLPLLGTIIILASYKSYRKYCVAIMNSKIEESKNESSAPSDSFSKKAVIGLISLVVFICLIAAFRMKVKADGDLTGPEGSAFGQKNTSKVCLDETINRLKNCDGEFCRLAQDKFAKGCLETASNAREVCEQLPEDLTNFTAWRHKTCDTINLSSFLSGFNCDLVMKRFVGHCYRLSKQKQEQSGK